MLIKWILGDWSETRFNEIKEEMTKMITVAGFKPKQVPFVPFSGFSGENLVEKSDKMPWYKGFSANLSKTEVVSGYTLLDALEKVAKPPRRFPEKPLRIPINGIYKIKGVGDVITGRVEQGTLNAGDVVRVSREGIENLKVFSIEMHHKTWPSAMPGDNVGMNMKGLDKMNMPKVGDVISLQNEILKPVKSFVCQVVVQEHPGQLKPGFSPCVHVRTAKSACKMSKIVWKMGKKTGNEKQEDPPFLEMGESAEIVFEPQQLFYLESFDQCEGLGRINPVMDSNQLVMLGKVMSVEYKPYIKNKNKNAIKIYFYNIHKPNFIDNIPKTNKKQEVLKTKHLESLKNKADQIKENFDKFDYFTQPVVGVDKHHSHVELPKKTQDIIVDQEQNDFGERYFTMLTGKKKEDLDVKQVPKLNGIEEQKPDKKKKIIKKINLIP